MQTLAINQAVGHYTIRKVLGSGGFGVTYLAEDEALGKFFAIKEYFPQSLVFRDGATVRSRTDATDDFKWGQLRFLEEARTLVQFSHPNIVDVTQIFEANNTAYMVLEYKQGCNFKTWLQQIDRPPNQTELDDFLVPLLDALELIHSSGILHRDIAPDNIYIRDDGSPVLLDFGSARQALSERSQRVSAIVKSGYSPHEQYATTGRNQGPWTDIYAMAATLYYAIAGKAPPEAADRILEDGCESAMQATVGDYRPEFLDAIDWALAITPKDRPQTIAKWRTRLLSGLAKKSNVSGDTVATYSECDGLGAPRTIRQDPRRLSDFLSILQLLRIVLPAAHWGVLLKKTQPKSNGRVRNGLALFAALSILVGAVWSTSRWLHLPGSMGNPSDVFAPASVNPADFWQRADAVIKGDYNGEIAEAVVLRPYSEFSTSYRPDGEKPIDKVVVIPARELTGSIASGYPSVSADSLPYAAGDKTMPYGAGNKTMVLDQRVQIGWLDPTNLTTVAKTPPPQPVHKIIRLAKNELLADRLATLGVTIESGRALAKAIEPLYPQQLLKVGQVFEITLDKRQDLYGNDVIFPVHVAFSPAPSRNIVVDTDEDGRFIARFARAEQTEQTELVQQARHANGQSRTATPNMPKPRPRPTVAAADMQIVPTSAPPQINVGRRLPVARQSRR